MSNRSEDILEGFKVTELGSLPDEWDVVTLKQIGTLQDGDWILRHDYSEDGVRLLQIADIGWGIFLDKSKRYISLERAKELGCTFLEAGDILLSRMGEPIGRACKLPILPYPTITAVDVTIFRTKSSVVDSNYVLFSLNSNIALGQAAQLAYGVTRNRITRRNLESILLPLPPLPEQKASAHVLSTIQKAIEKQDKIITAARELKKSLMRHLFIYGPVPVAEAEQVPLKETEIGPVPEHWEVKLLLNTATLQRGKDLPKQNQIPGKYPIVGSSGVIGYHNTFVCDGPGVVTGRSGSIGNLAYVEDNYWPHNTGLYVKDFHGNEPKFIYYLLHLVDFHKYATGVSVPTLNRNFVHSALVPIPPIKEQQQITDMLTSVDKKIEAEEKRKESLKALFKTMLNQLMTGKVRVKELEAMAA